MINFLVNNYGKKKKNEKWEQKLRLQSNLHLNFVKITLIQSLNIEQLHHLSTVITIMCNLQCYLENMNFQIIFKDSLECFRSNIKLAPIFQYLSI